MRHIIFENADSYPIAILSKATAFNKLAIQEHYVDPLTQRGVDESYVIAFTLKHGDNGKASAALIKGYLAELLPTMDSIGVLILYVTDAAYFKVLTGQAKADPHFGYVLPCKIKGYGHMSVVLGLNHQQLIYNPDLQAKLDLSLDTVAAHSKGTYQPLGEGIITNESYPATVQEIADKLEWLHQHPRLTVDIEGFSLDFDRAGIGTICFAWNQNEGTAFACDYKEYETPVDDGIYGHMVVNHEVRALLRRFFESYQGEITFHYAPYDVKSIICSLWMDTLLDTEGLLQGLEVMCRHIHDTKIIAYLATNSTAGNVLSLKALAHEFAGNWAIEVRDIRKIPLAKLLRYNLVDGLSTYYVRNKYYPIMVADQQEAIYKELFLPSLKLIIQIELTGMPLHPDRVAEVKKQLEDIRETQLAVMLGSTAVTRATELLRISEWEKDFEDRKSKAKNPHKIKPKELSAFDTTAFNPNSGPQLQRLLYEVMGLPILDRTDTKQPATGAETIEKLINHTEDAGYKQLLQALIIYGGVAKILNTFIPAFEQALDKGDGVIWLHGCFNLGGTVSGRLSSSDPNLQNIPANVFIEVGEVKIELGKLIKSCFMGPAGWLFAGADFNSLEDYISALTTKDPNKLAVYEKGFDGHCLRAAYYFRDQVPHIDLTDPDSVNTLKNTHKHLRQDSKAPTFLLTYGGTYHGMMSNLGWPEDMAKRIEANYHELYKESDEYVRRRLEQASKDGYVTVAFGLRVRTPMLAQVVFGGTKMPYEAAAEGRTAGNAMGQSYGLLNNRAAVDFMIKVWASPYRLDIKPIGLIHDAIYILIKDQVEIVEWANRELILSMRWQELPEIQHPTVKLGAALDIFWPSWATATTLPNDADKETLIKVCNATKENLLKEE